MDMPGAILAGGLITGLLFLAGGAQGQVSSPDCENDTETSTGTVFVDGTDNRVTLRACSADIQLVLDALASHAGIDLVNVRTVGARVNLGLNDVSLHEAVSRLLRGRSFMLLETPPTGRDVAGAANRSTLWVFTDGADTTPVDGDVRRRVAAVRAARKLDRDAARAALALALADEDPRVRASAIHGLASLGGDEVADPLATALLDAEAWVRVEAVYALGSLGNPGAIQTIQAATNDVDPRVAEAVRDVLDTGRQR